MEILSKNSRGIRDVSVLCCCECVIKNTGSRMCVNGFNFLLNNLQNEVFFLFVCFLVCIHCLLWKLECMQLGLIPHCTCDFCTLVCYLVMASYNQMFYKCITIIADITRYKQNKLAYAPKLHVEI